MFLKCAFKYPKKNIAVSDASNLTTFPFILLSRITAIFVVLMTKLLHNSFHDWRAHHHDRRSQERGGKRRHGRSCAQSASTGQTGYGSTYSQSRSRVAILCLTFTEIVHPNSAGTSSLRDSTAASDDRILPGAGISFAAKSSCPT